MPLYTITIYNLFMFPSRRKRGAELSEKVAGLQMDIADGLLVKCPETFRNHMNVCVRSLTRPRLNTFQSKKVLISDCDM